MSTPTRSTPGGARRGGSPRRRGMSPRIRPTDDVTATPDDARVDPDPDQIGGAATLPGDAGDADTADDAENPDDAPTRGGEQADQAAPPRPRRVVRPPRRWPWILGMVLAAVVLIGGFVTVWWTPLLGLRTVQVSGVQDDVRTQVQAAVGVTAGTPLARIDLDAVSARVADVPVVASVQVSRGWPDALDVQVVARVPVAVTQANGSWWLMDAAGDPYVPVAAAPAGLPVVELATPGAGDPATVAALTVARALPDGLRAQVAAVAARTAFDVTLRLADGRTVVWGDAVDATQTARKIEVLPALLQQDGTVLDVSDPTLVTVR